MAAYKIHLKLNDKTYFIQNIVVKNDNQDVPTTSITWTLQENEVAHLTKKQVDIMLDVLARDGRDYRASRIV